jgi:hypothetical protein
MDTDKIKLGRRIYKRGSCVEKGNGNLGSMGEFINVACAITSCDP